MVPNMSGSSIISEVGDEIERVMEEQQMPTKMRRKNTEPTRADDVKARNQRDERWEERLRCVGDARFVEVEWSGRDNPSWPLPIK